MKWVVALLVLSLAAFAQDADIANATERVEVRVTAVLGDAIYLDRGADARLQVGDRLTLRPAGRPVVEGELQLVTRASSRAVLFGALQDISPGDVGEVFVPAGRAVASETTPGVVWEHEPEEFDPARPLLTPSAHTPPAEQPSTLHGRAFGAFDFYTDGEEGGGEAWLARTGVDAKWTNPFGRGGVLDVRTEVFRRQSEFDATDEELTRLRIDRLSYRIGDTREDPRSIGIGRFLHTELSELGLLDGVEFVQRMPNGDRLGASFGYLPEPFAELDTGDDLAASVFYRGFIGAGAELSYAGAFQKTWHDGDADRDLVLAALDWVPGEVFSLHGNAWLDLYGSDALTKDSGPELTELHLAANWRFESERGFGLSATHVKWPEFERDEFPEASLADLAEAEVTRLGANAFTAVGRRLRLRGRADVWEDEDESGTSGELELARTNAPSSRGYGEVALAVFANDAKWLSVYGARISTRRRAGGFGWRLSYEAAFFDTGDFGDFENEELQHLARVGIDREFGRAWSLSLDGDARFGDDQSGYALGLNLSRRF